MVTGWVSSSPECQAGRSIDAREPWPNGVVMVVQVPFWDELPRIALVVDLGGAGTGGSRAGGAVVLTFQGDAVALAASCAEAAMARSERAAASEPAKARLMERRSIVLSP